MATQGCNEEKPTAPQSDGQSDEIDFILQIPTRAGDDDNYLEDPNDYFTEGESTVLISQRTSNMGMSFNEGNSNCYKYVYYRNDEADWDNSFNFKSVRPLGWDKITANGQYGNSYAFGALFFPKSYEYIDRVNPDQSNAIDWAESDVMGAFHRAEEGERLRFRLNHLMSRLHINLYVPVWDDKNSTGFNEGSVKEAVTISFRTDYTIEWGEVSSEIPPKASPSLTDEGETANIKMCLRDSIEKPFEMDLSEFKIADLQKDVVRKYTFEVLFPEQNVNNNFLRFTLTRGNTEYNYVFGSAHYTNGTASFRAGEITNLELYLPRTDIDLLLLDANIIKWNEANASFTITNDALKESE